MATHDDSAGLLATVRADPRRRRAALAVAVVVGLAAAWVHWVGLVLGGALVGLATRSLPRALAGGLAFGLVTLAVFAGWLAVQGSLAGVVGSGLPAYVAAGAGLVLPVVGATLRGAI